MYRLVNLLAKVIPWHQVMRRKPAAYPPVLQVGMQSRGKVNVRQGVADKARMVLHWLLHRGSIEINPRVGHTCSAQKVQRAAVLWQLHRLQLNDRRTEVVDVKQPLRLAQIILCKYRTADFGPVQIGPAQAGPVQVGPVQIGPAQVGPVQVGHAQINFLFGMHA